MSQKFAQVAVIGATGVVGREMLAGLQELGYPDDKVTALASERSEGEEVEYAGETLGVEKASAESFRGLGLVLMAAPAEAAPHLARAAQSAGAWVVDASSAFRQETQVPLVLPGVNEQVLDVGFSGRIVCVPSATTTGLMLVLEPLRRALGLRRVHFTALVGASHWGTRGVRALEKQTADLLGGREPEAEFVPHRMGFNIVPQVGPFEGDWNSEERAVLSQARRLWEGQPELPELEGTVVQVPTFYGTCFSISIQLRQPGSVERIRQVLQGAPQLKVLDRPAEGIYPMPMLVTADPTVHVGRIRATSGDWVHLFAAVDNAGRGAAVGAVAVGQRLLAREV